MKNDRRNFLSSLQSPRMLQRNAPESHVSRALLHEHAQQHCSHNSDKRMERRSKQQSYFVYRRECDTQRVELLSYSAFCRACLRIESWNEFQFARARQRAKALSGCQPRPARRIGETIEIHRLLTERTLASYGVRARVSVALNALNKQPRAFVCHSGTSEGTSAVLLLQEYALKWKRVPSAVVVDHFRDDQMLQKYCRVNGIQILFRSFSSPTSRPPINGLSADYFRGISSGPQSDAVRRNPSAPE